MAYLLDTNVFMQAKNREYGFDFCPAFWDWLLLANSDGRVFSIEKVGDEIAAVADQLSEWAAQRGPSFFLRPDPAMAPALAGVSSWISRQSYSPNAVSNFLSGADFFIVAHALAHRHSVVTHEKPGATKTVKIPDACIALGVKCMNPYEMLRYERARFVLGSTP